MPAKFTVYLDKAQKFRFNLKATNGEIIAVGESYPDKKSALKGIASIVKNAPVAKIVDTTLAEETPKASKVKKTVKRTVKAKKPAKRTAKVKKPAKKAVKRNTRKTTQVES
jgi:uncharacterized protein YegP (UPF0339 family)